MPRVGRTQGDRVLNSAKWEFLKESDKDQGLMGKRETGSTHEYFQYKNFTVSKAIDEPRSVPVCL